MKLFCFRGIKWGSFRGILNLIGGIWIVSAILYAILHFISGNIQSLNNSKENSSGSNQILRNIVGASFSPDNSKLVFGYCEGNEANNLVCELATYEIASNVFHSFNPLGKDFSIIAPSYSHDGKQITFAAVKRGKSGNIRDKYSNIYVINTDGSGLHQLTRNYSTVLNQPGTDMVVEWNAVPSFSPDDKRVIFRRAGVLRQRSMGGEMLSHWDAYEVEIEAGQEHRLTSYALYEMSRPYYLADGKRFIFSCIQRGQKNANEAIYIMDEKHNTLTPAFMHGWYSTDPSVSKEGAILFLSETSKMEGIAGPYNYDLFIKTGDSIKRLTNRRFTHIFQPSLSYDGTRIVFLASETKDEGPRMWVMNSDGSGLMKLIPDLAQLKK